MDTPLEQYIIHVFQQHGCTIEPRAAQRIAQQQRKAFLQRVRTFVREYEFESCSKPYISYADSFLFDDSSNDEDGSRS
jgi:hypothetical protein